MIQEPGPSAAVEGDAPSRVMAFLGAARRRLLLRRVLQACLGSLAAGFAIRLLTVLANRFAGTSLPVFFLELLLLPVLVVLALVSFRLPETASRADAEIGLKDRLMSFLDFGSRDDVDRSFRRAQEAETARTVTDVAVRRALRINPLLWGAPLVYLAGAAFLVFDTYLPEVTLMVQERVPWRSRQGAGHGGPDLAGDGEVRTADGGAPSSPGEPSLNDATATGGEGGEDAKPEEPAPSDGSAGEPEKAPGGDVSSAEAGAGTGKGGRARFDLDPDSLFRSETVGEALTPVADSGAVRAPGAERPRLDLPRGRQLFNLLPRGRRGEGEGPALGGKGGRERVRIVVDFDAIPPEYREYIRAYFQNLNEEG